LFRRVIELNPRDFSANFEVAFLFEQNDPKQALIYYEAGISIMREELQGDGRFVEDWASSFEDPAAHLELAREMIPPELLSNTGVLLMEVERHEEAEVFLEEALKNTEKLL